MGRIKKGHNWKARQPVKTSVDRTEENKLEVSIEGVDIDKYDESNVLALPSKKRSTKVKTQEEVKVKKLSKKQKKLLEKVVQRKEKKSKRAEILETLQNVQASSSELAMFTSVTDMHSGRMKRKPLPEEENNGAVKINAISGSNKRRKRAAEQVEEESSSSSSDSETEGSNTDDDDDGAAVTDQETSSAEQPIQVEETKPDGPDSGPSAKDSKDKGNQKQVEAKMEDTSHEKTLVKPIHVPIAWSPEIQAQRLLLPILGEEQVIMEKIRENPVVIICGETGSGKTTQLPQFLYEAGYAHGNGIIGITEPRRVAAISMSRRVGQEMSLPPSVVSYQIRYEGNATKDTKLKFMTDGVMLKEVQSDFMLSKYSVIIIDEAHERSVFTDILIGLLSRIVPLRHKKGNPLKLIIMSATLRVEDFTENKVLFKVTPPVVKVESRQFPVATHFNKRTPQHDEYVKEALRKVCKIHQQLPEGGILVFVTGQQEVHSLCAKLRATFPFHTDSDRTRAEEDEEAEDEAAQSGNARLPRIRLDDYSAVPLDEEAELHRSDSAPLSDDEGDMAGDRDGLQDSVKGSTLNRGEQPMYVLPLYSLLSSSRQAKVFDSPPEGSRLCVVTTNVAETSLTIPNIKYVVDTGKVKTKFYDKVTGVSTFKVRWTSKASANQRAGRAGRTGAGHCYRLYSSAVFNDDFEKFSPPEITRRPVDDLMLQMKDMNIDRVVNFPFPTPPDTEALVAAEKLLIALGALKRPEQIGPAKAKNTKEASSKITALGKAMACFPVSPRYGKMLSLGHQHDLLPYVTAIVAALSVQELLVETERPASSSQSEEHKAEKQKLVQLRRTWAGMGHSRLLGDLMVLLKAVGACEYAGVTTAFCQSHGIRYKAMTEVRKLRAQLTNSVNSIIPDADLVLDPQMAPPSDLQAKLLRQIVLAGLSDHVAQKMPAPPRGTEDAKKFKHAYQSLILEEPVFIHPGSVLNKQNMPFVVFQTIEETSKLYMKGVVAVEPEWLPVFVPHQCQFSKPQDDPPPRFNQSAGTVVCHMTSTFGPHFWQLPAVELEYPEGLDRYRHFARALLEGKVCPRLEKFASSLLITPVTMVKSWARLQPKTETLLKTLVAENVDCKASLENVWAKKSKYLLSAYCEWLPESLHWEVRDVWPPK